MSRALSPFPFSIFSGEGGTGFGTTDCLVREDVEEVAVVAEFILTLAPSVFTRFGIFSRLTTGTGPHGLSLDTLEENTVCCLLLEVSRLSLGALNGFELLLTGLWLLIQVFGFICTCDALLELEGGEVGDGEGLHIEPCLLSQCDWNTWGFTT